MIMTDLETLKELDAKRTQGEWEALPIEPRSECLSIYADDIVCRLWWMREEDHSLHPDHKCEANAAFIVALVNAFPALMEAAEALESLNGLSSELYAIAQRYEGGHPFGRLVRIADAISKAAATLSALKESSQ